MSDTIIPAYLTIENQFDNLRTISTTVSEYLQSEIFKDDYGAYGDFTVNDVLQQCYTIILQELSEYGITLDTDYEDLLGDWYTANHIYLLRKWIDSSCQLELLKSNPDDVSYLADICADNEHTPDEIYESWCTYYAEHHPQEDTAAITYVTHWVRADQRLVQHLKALLQSLEDASTPVVIPDIQRAQRYIEKVQLARVYVEQMVSLIYQALPDEIFDTNLVRKLIREYDLDKISPDTIKIYSTIDLDDVPVFLIPYKNEQLLIHHRRSPHHVEYWCDPAKDPQPVPTKENILLMVCHHMEPGTTPEEFKQAIDNMIDAGHAVFTPEHLSYINQYANILLKQAQHPHYQEEDSEASIDLN